MSVLLKPITLPPMPIGSPAWFDEFVRVNYVILVQYVNALTTGGGGGLADPGANGIVVRTALNVTVARTLTTDTTITIVNPDGVAGNPAFSRAALTGDVTAPAGSNVTTLSAALVATFRVPGPPGVEGDEGAPGPPGPAGATGPAGSAGAAGPGGPPGYDGADGDDGFMAVPGPAGAAGSAGTAGPSGVMGPPGFGAEGDDGPMGFSIVGPTGPQGPAGGGGGTATTVEVNLGAYSTRGKFTITDAGISGTSKINVWQAPGPYTGKGTRADEAEMQPVQIIATAPAAGSATCYWRALGHVAVIPQSFDGSHGGRPQIAVPVAQTANDNIDSRYFALAIGKVGGNVKFTYMVL